MTIERAKPEDKKELYELFGDWDMDYVFDYGVFSSGFDRIVASETNIVLLAREDGKLAGYAQFFPCDELGFEPFYEIAELLVSAAERSRGIGRALLAAVEEHAQKNGIFCVKLSSQLHRSRAHVFYENSGYVNHKVSKFYEKTL